MIILASSNHGNTFNPKEGGDIRKYYFIKELAKRNDIIVLESDRYISDESKVPTNIEICYFHDYYFLGKPISLFLDFNFSFIYHIFNLIKNKNINIIQISFFYGVLVTKLITTLMRRKIPIIYDAHNVEGDAVKQTKKGSIPEVLRLFTLIYIPLLERFACHAADHIISVSNDDKLLFIDKYGLSGKKITVIPSGAQIRKVNTIEKRDYFKKKFGIKENLVVVLFHGTYHYPPNKEAMDLISDYVAPKVGAKCNNVLFLLAGNGVPIFEKGNVKSIGFVEDLSSLLYAVDIAIVPILRGGGTRLKILDYMSVGLPIISTKKGIEGIEVTEGKNAIIFDDVNDKFIEGILDLLYDREKRISLGVNSYELAKEKYNWEEIGKKLNQLYTGFTLY